MDTSTDGLSDEILLESVDGTHLPPYYDNYSDYDWQYWEELCARQARRQRFENIINIGVVGLLILGGWIGNTLAIVVLRSDRSNKTVNFLLQALAMADNMYLLACLLFQTLRAVSTSTDWLPRYAYIEQYSWAFAAIAQTTTVWIVVLVTADRYIAICHPFKVSCLCTLARAKCMVISIVVFAVIYNIPRFFEQMVEQSINTCTQQIYYVTRRTDFRNNRLYFLIYKTCLYFIFRLFFPLITLFILNLKLIFVLKSATKSRASLTNSSGKKTKKDSVTFVLVIVVSVFLLCELPDALLRLLATISYFSDFRMDSIRLSYANTISNMFLTLNSSVNCLIYSITGSTFRRRLGRLCSAARRRQRRHGSYVHYDYHCTDEHQGAAGTGGMHHHKAGACLANKLRPATGARTWNNGTGAFEVNTSSSLLKETGM